MDGHLTSINKFNYDSFSVFPHKVCTEISSTNTKKAIIKHAIEEKPNSNRRFKHNHNLFNFSTTTKKYIFMSFSIDNNSSEIEKNWF